jgi:hypothetical protein
MLCNIFSVPGGLRSDIYIYIYTYSLITLHQLIYQNLNCCGVMNVFSAPVTYEALSYLF